MTHLQIHSMCLCDCRASTVCSRVWLPQRSLSWGSELALWLRSRFLDSPEKLFFTLPSGTDVQTKTLVDAQKQAKGDKQTKVTHWIKQAFIKIKHPHLLLFYSRFIEKLTNKCNKIHCFPLDFWPFWWGWGVNLDDLFIKCAAFLSVLLKELNVMEKKTLVCLQWVAKFLMLSINNQMWKLVFSLVMLNLSSLPALYYYQS